LIETTYESLLLVLDAVRLGDVLEVQVGLSLGLQQLGTQSRFSSALLVRDALGQVVPLELGQILDVPDISGVESTVLHSCWLVGWCSQARR